MRTLQEIRTFLKGELMDESERAIRLKVLEMVNRILRSGIHLGQQRDLTQVKDAFKAAAERLRSNAGDSRALLLAEVLWPFWSYWEVQPQLNDSVFDPVFAQCVTCHACWMFGGAHAFMDTIGACCTACDAVYCRKCASNRSCPRCGIGLSGEYRPNGRTYRPFQYFRDISIME